ncbi:fimbrillin family protein [Porphyromonas somerae]|uniref:fimbrillin family protein n=1 Tax=Porphyromonas somerae TaxID=322095 RepID=UPI001FCA79EF|nr:fimbrillin family protein [Porphyromonas somerae]
MWGEQPADSLLITTVEQIDEKWKIADDYQLKNKALLSIVSPFPLKRHKEALLVMEQDQTPIYYASKELSVPSEPLQLELKQVQATISLRFDLREFAPNDVINEVRIRTEHTYGWIHLNSGNFITMEVPYDETVVFTKSIEKPIQTLTSNQFYTYEHLVLPQGKCHIYVWIMINGKDYVATLKADELKSNYKYQYDIHLFNRYALSDLSEEEKNRGSQGTNENIENILFTDYEYTMTSEYINEVSNNHAALFSFWLDSRVDESKELEYKLVLRDATGEIVARSPIYGGLTIKPYHYDGFSVPIYINVDKVGVYTHQLLLREKGKTNWYEPDQKSDDTLENKQIRIWREHSAFISAFRLDKGGRKNSIGEITAREYNKNYTAHLTISNYAKATLGATIKLYSRRDPKSTHGNIILDDETTWNDLIGTKKVLLDAFSSNEVYIPYTITVRRPSVKRFAPYICATITYDDDSEEYPLLLDGDMIYKMTSGVYNPNQLISSSFINNKAYIDVID